MKRDRYALRPRWRIKGIIVAGACAAAFPSGACAEGIYTGLEGGVIFQQPVGYNFAGLSNFFSTKYKPGVDVAGKVGYDLEGVRFELELGFKRARTQQFGFQINGQPLAVQTGSAVSGDVHSFSGTLNMFWDITQGRFRPYVGAGLGAARITSDKVGYSGFGDVGVFLNKSAVAFALQAMGGFDIRVTRRISVHAGYRFFDAEKVDLHAFNTTVRGRFRSSSAMIGVTLHFGHSERDTLPPPAPPPATVQDINIAGPAEQAISATNYSLVFATHNIALSADARAQLDQAVIAYGQADRLAIMVMGTAEDDGPVVYNESLAQHRAFAIRDYLKSKGVPDAAISIQSFEYTTVDSRGSHGLSGPVKVQASIYISFGLGSGE